MWWCLIQACPRLWFPATPDTVRNSRKGEGHKDRTATVILAGGAVSHRSVSPQIVRSTTCDGVATNTQTA